MDRVTVKQLEVLVSQINKLTNSPVSAYTTKPVFKSNVGNFHLSSALYGTELLRMTNEGGGVDVVFGYTTKRDLKGQLQAFIRGLEIARSEPKIQLDSNTGEESFVYSGPLTEHIANQMREFLLQGDCKHE